MNRNHLTSLCVGALLVASSVVRAEESIAEPVEAPREILALEAATVAAVTSAAAAAAPAAEPKADEKPTAEAAKAGETPPAEPAADPNPVDAGNEPIVIDYNEADIQSVVRTLGAKAGINLILGDEVTGKVTVHLEGVGYEDAMRLIVESKGYAYIKDKNVVRVKSLESVDAEPVELRVVTLNYAKADDVRRTLEPMLSKQGRVQVDTRSNTLLVSDTPSNLAKLIPLIESLDTQTPQVMIEAKFIETTKNPRKDLGINWDQTLLNHPLSAGPFTLTKDLNGGPWAASTVLLDAGSVNLVMSYLNRDSDTELLASPRVVTTDNGKAKVAIATQYPIPNFQFSESTGSFQINGFEYKDIGITLNVTPRINKNDFVTLEVTPEASTQTGTADLSSGGSTVQIPIIDTRTATTTVLIKSGNTLVIGGLMRSDIIDRYTKVPIAGDIPGVGAFFRSKSLSKLKQNLLIFVTPTIVKPESQTGYEQYYSGFPQEELYTNDKWMPRDNAKPNWRNLVPQGNTRPPAPNPPPAPNQNFRPR